MILIRKLSIDIVHFAILFFIALAINTEKTYHIFSKLPFWNDAMRTSHDTAINR